MDHDSLDPCVLMLENLLSSRHGLPCLSLVVRSQDDSADPTPMIARLADSVFPLLIPGTRTPSLRGFDTVDCGSLSPSCPLSFEHSVVLCVTLVQPPLFATIQAMALSLPR